MTRNPTVSTAPIQRKGLVLAVLVTAQLMVILDGTIVTIALPAAQEDLGFGDDGRQWVVTAYALAFGSLLLLGGRLADLFGQKRAFIVGLVGFAAASALGGLAPSFGLLIVARAAQGAFGALLAPAALSLMTTTFTDERERARAFGVFGAVGASGGAMGLLLGGALTQYLSWRWCMFVNIAFAAVALAGAVALLPRLRSAVRPRLDVLGAVTVTVGLVAIVYGFGRVETEGWGDPLVIASLAAGALIIGLFVQIERHTTTPLLPLRVVMDRDRGGSLLALVLTNFGLLGLFLFLAFYTQLVLDFTALQTGFAFVPFPFAVIIGANVLSGPLLPRVGPRVLIVTGALIAAAGLFILQALATEGSYFPVVLPSLLVSGLGTGMIFTAAVSTATLGVDADDAGVAGAVANMAQQIGGSIGTAVLSSIYGSAAAGYLAGRTDTDAVADAAAVHGYHVTFAVAAISLLATALVGGLLVRGQRDRASPSTDPTHAMH